MTIDQILRKKKIDRSFIKECISAADSNLFGDTLYRHSVPNSLQRLPLFPQRETP